MYRASDTLNAPRHPGNTQRPESSMALLFHLADIRDRRQLSAAGFPFAETFLSSADFGGGISVGPARPRKAHAARPLSWWPMNSPSNSTTGAELLKRTSVSRGRHNSGTR